MKTTHSPLSARLIAAALTATLGLASPAFASKSEGHSESHAEDSHDQGKKKRDGSDDLIKGGRDNGTSSGGQNTGSRDDNPGSHKGGGLDDSIKGHKGGGLDDSIKGHSGGGLDDSIKGHSGGGLDDSIKGHNGGNLGNGTNGQSNDRGGNSGGISSSPTVAAMLRTVLTGTVEPGARGEVKLRKKLRGNQFEAEAALPLPSVALALAGKAAVQNATLTLALSRAGKPYAECDFDLKSIKMTKKKTAGIAKYRIEIYNRGGVLQERYGICDLDLAVPGVQPGLPAIQSGDAAAVVIDTNNVSFLDGIF